MRPTQPAGRPTGRPAGRPTDGTEKSDHCVELKLRSGVDGIIERHPVTRRAKGRAKCKLNQEDARARTPSAPIRFRRPRARSRFCYEKMKAKSLDRQSDIAHFALFAEGTEKVDEFGGCRMCACVHARVCVCVLKIYDLLSNRELDATQPAFTISG